MIVERVGSDLYAGDLTQGLTTSYCRGLNREARECEKASAMGCITNARFCDRALA
jgi:hypothetical protein